MRVLFLAHLFPLPLDSGGKIKSYYTLKALASRHEVHLVSFLRSSEEERCVSGLESIGVRTRAIKLNRSRLRQVSDLAGSLLTARPFIITRDYRREMRQAVLQAVNDLSPDVIHVDHLQMAQYAGVCGGCRVVLDNHNVESMIIKRISETAQSRAMRVYARMEWPKLRRYEIQACRASDMVLTVSEEDRATLLNLDRSLAKVHCVPIGTDIDYYQPVERTAGSLNILSIGTMYWPPNVDSMLYFTREILPLVRREIPDSTLTIAGQRPVESVLALAKEPGIRVTGYVDDEREIARDCGVFVVPLRSGSGVRVKILNALAMGLPVVSTSIGAEGLDVRSGEHLLIADDPPAFADAVVRVLRDPELAAALGRNGRQLVCEKHSWDRVGQRLLGLYDERLSR